MYNNNIATIACVYVDDVADVLVIIAKIIRHRNK